MISYLQYLVSILQYLHQNIAFHCDIFMLTFQYSRNTIFFLYSQLLQGPDMVFGGWVNPKIHFQAKCLQSMILIQGSYRLLRAIFQDFSRFLTKKQHYFSRLRVGKSAYFSRRHRTDLDIKLHGKRSPCIGIGTKQNMFDFF